ncbi:MAG: SurA N-terminal domain-containing protein [Paludibacteraceae bacterium]|nr:SurA N-terminal domain-containing protein [Paludibacteraceae bacterium]
MATIGNIRKHGALLVTLIAIAMLAFILGDFLSSSNTYFSRSREYVGEIEGHKIHYTEYEAAKEQLNEVYKIETGRNDFDEDMVADMNNRVWQMFVSDYAMQAQAEKIGMTVTPDELSELCIGNNIHQIISSRRVFFDQTGQFNRNYLVQFLNSLEQDSENPEDQANLQKAKTYWAYWEKAVKITYLQEKYIALLSNLVTANKLDAKFAFDARQTSVDVEYLAKPYFAVADSLVKVTDADLKALYKKHKAEYKQDPNRSISYVAFPIVPSQEDTLAVAEKMEQIKDEFYTTDDVMTVVNLNSDVMYDGRDYSIDNVPEEYKEFAFGAGAKTGNVTDIKLENNAYSMARLVKAGYSLPDSVELKAIAMDTTQKDQELGWYKAEDLDKKIAEAAFSTKKGERFTLPMGMGEQTFEVMNISAPTPKVQLAIISISITPSSKTYAALFNRAKQFIVENTTEEKFNEAAAEDGIPVHPAYNLQPTTNKVDNLKSSRQIVRWAFQAKQGQLSDVFECGDRFVVAVLTEINEDEYRPFEQVQNELRFEALNNAKYDYLAKQLKGVNTLEEAEKTFGDVEIQKAEGVTLASYRFGNMGAEPAVIGAAMATEAGKTSEPVKGIQAVYVLRPGEKVVKEGTFDEASEVAQLNSRYTYSLPYQALQMVEKKADIEDKRFNFQ